MTVIPTTTKLNPDQSALRDLIRRLAEIESPDAPMVSVYLDLRPESGGDDPTRIPAMIVLKDRLLEIEQSLPAHGEAADSFRADAERIQAHLTGHEARRSDGLAIFACSAREVWETVPAGVPFDTQISVGPAADLFQLARLLDEHESAVVAVVDTNTCRLFVTRRGGLVETSGRDEPSDLHKHHEQGGWSQARYQRHVEEQDHRFAREAADAIARLVQREAATRVVLAGQQRGLLALKGELPKEVLALVHDEEAIQTSASAGDVASGIRPALERAEAASSADVADRVVAGVRAGQLGVAGLDATMRALEIGQVDELVIDQNADLDEEIRAELVRQAALTSARVEVVTDHEGLARFGGVGGTLRYRVE